MDGGIFLSRGPGHDGNAGVEEVVAGQLKVGMPTSKDLRE